MDNPEKQETMDTRQTKQNTKYRKRKRWATRTPPTKTRGEIRFLSWISM